MAVVPEELDRCLAELGLVDHHAHGALRTPVDRSGFESMLTESPDQPPSGTGLDTPLGFALRRWCPPVIDLPEHASADDYWRRRTELGEDEVTRRMLAAAGIEAYLLDTGYLGERLMDPAQHARAASAQTREVLRAESVAEELLAGAASAEAFVDGFGELLATRSRGTVGLKSVIAYRYGFDFDPHRPGRAEVLAAVSRQLVGDPEELRITDPVLLRFVLWSAVDAGLPIQLHSGLGDPDLDLHRANPLLLTGWLRLVAERGVPVVLLHNYPFHREAGYLAHAFEHVYFDVGLGVNYLGARSRQLLAEALELAPFRKQLFSTDACGPAELHFLGAALWRHGMRRVLGAWVREGEWSQTDAVRVARRVGRENARRLYGLSGG